MQAIVGGKVFTMEGQTFDSGTVLFNDGKIVAVGSKVDVPFDAKVFDAAGKFVFPGFIDAHTHMGIIEEGVGEVGDDCNDLSGPIAPHLRAIDAVNPADPAFRDALAAGVTTVVTGPGSGNVLGGEMVALKVFGATVEDMLLKFPVGLKGALGENPKRIYGKLDKTPTTRMEEAALLREALVAAQNYLAKLSPHDGIGAKSGRDLKMESLARVLKGEIPLRIHAHRADDIMTALRIAREFKVDLVVEHCTEGYKVAERLAEAGIPAVVGPILVNRAKVEMRELNIRNACELASAGVLLAIMTDHPEVPVQHLLLSAALTVRAGLPEDEALKAITINPALIAGLDNRIGSLAPGKDADIVVFDRHPLDLYARLEKTFLDGKLIFS